MKKYRIQHGIGKAKYLVSHYDGIKKHNDGSDFYDVRIFKNKKSLNEFKDRLTRDGYKEF